MLFSIKYNNSLFFPLISLLYCSFILLSPFPLSRSLIVLFHFHWVFLGFVLLFQFFMNSINKMQTLFPESIDKLKVFFIFFLSSFQTIAFKTKKKNFSQSRSIRIDISFVLIDELIKQFNLFIHIHVQCARQLHTT